MGGTMGATALLVVDVQKALFERGTPIYRADHLLETINQLIEQARLSGAPVVFIQHSNKMMRPESPAWELHPALAFQEGDLVVSKTHGNAFEKTDLDSELKARGVSAVVVTGLVTHGCVRATCLGGHALGYDVVLVADAHSSYNKDAASLIEKWNRDLAEELTAVSPAGQVHFGGAG